MTISKMAGRYLSPNYPFPRTPIPGFDPVGPQEPPTTRRRQRSVAGARRRVAGPSYGLPGQTDVER